ncbi:MAG TPA: metallophosphoesterase family protein [Thermoanaerobaculia bacterium]|nr:metallophosphoesterase family protein [Thermoanaerobaculia bacterium]
MLIALMADIHANREAFEACLADAREHGAERFVFLGDYVNYGADPEWVVQTLTGLVSNGAVAVLGNHDAAACTFEETMDSPAATALEWTRVQLGAAERAFLAGLPVEVKEDGRLYVHADAAAPRRWIYVRDASDALHSLGATEGRMTFCGHVHEPAIYSVSAALKVTSFRPVAGAPVPLLPQRRWLCVLGSVGQPRDGDPSACYALLDAGTSEMTYRRVPYDVDAAAAKILAAGLPEELAERLKWGR